MTWKKHQFWAKNTATHRGKRLPSPSWHCSVVKGFGCSWLWPAPIRLILMFGRGPRWGSKINIMFSFFRALFARTTCRFVVINQHFINQYSKCIKKKIFPREGSACHIFFFHNTGVQNTQTHKIITGLMKPAFCIYTISHTLVKCTEPEKTNNKKQTCNTLPCLFPFFPFYIHIS